MPTKSAPSSTPCCPAFSPTTIVDRGCCLMRILLVPVGVVLLGLLGLSAQGQTATVKTLATGIPEPNYGVMQASDGTFYSTTPPEESITVACDDNSADQCSYLYKISPNGVASVFHTFTMTNSTNVEGYSPTPPLEAPDGNLYGTCTIGGAKGIGTIWKITPAGVLTVLYTFAPNDAGYDVDGARPGPLTLGNDGYFYGVTEYGGDGVQADGNATFFKIGPAGDFTKIHSFTTADGASPYVFGMQDFSLVQGTDSNFYGGGQACTTSDCTASTDVIYSISPDGAVKVVYTLPQGTSASGEPYSHRVPGPFTVGPDGAFYGVSVKTPAEFGGVAASTFRFTSSGLFRTLFTFDNGAGGASPDPRLTLGSDGNFYGSTRFGGDLAACPQANGCGTLFQQEPGGPFKSLYSFSGTDGGAPEGPMVQIGDGTFVGTNNGADLPSGPTAGIVYAEAITPALAAPVQVTLKPTTISPNQPVTLTWKVLNAFSATMQQCHAIVLNASTGGAAGAGKWSGPQTGSMVGGVYTGTATIMPTMNGTYTYALNCGGVESGSATLNVGSGLTIVNTSLPMATVSKTYSVLFQAMNGTEPYTWTAGSELPSGLTLSNTGTLTGTPKQFGSYQVVVGVHDSSTPQGMAAVTLPLTIDSGLMISPTLANPTLNEKYSGMLKGSGGYGAYHWTVSAGKLPDGFTLNATTGVITGTATKVATSTFTVMLTDSESPAAKVTQAFSITTQVQPLQVNEGKFPDCLVGKECEGQFAATGGVAPYTWAIAKGATFPAGLTLDQDGGMTGKPTQYQSDPYILAVTVTDSSSPALQQNGSVTLLISSGLEITALQLPTATVGVAYEAPPPTAAGGIPPYTWSVRPEDANLLKEYSVDPATGVLKSTGPVTPGTFKLQYTVQDAEKSPAFNFVNATLTVVLQNQPTTTTLTTSNSVAGTGEKITLTAKVTDASGVPTGLVTFYSGSTSLGTANLDGTGSATLTTSFSTAGTYSLTAGYSGNGAATGSVSTPLTETVVTPTVTGNITPGTLTLVSGQDGTLRITLTPTGDYTGNVTFSCGQLPAHVSCAFAPPSLTIAAGSGPVTDSLTINTDAKTSAMLHQSSAQNSWENAWAAAFWLPASLLGIFGVRRSRKRLPKLLAVCAVACFMGMVSGLTGCGSAPSTAKAGTYSIPITLTLAGGMAQSITATVIVK